MVSARASTAGSHHNTSCYYALILPADASSVQRLRVLRAAAAEAHEAPSPPKVFRDDLVQPHLVVDV